MSAEIIDKRLITTNEELQVPVVVTANHRRDECDVYVPDFEITIHGTDYVTAIANAIMTASAIYYYNLERNVRMTLDTTYEDAERMCKGKFMFATYIGLTA